MSKDVKNRIRAAHRQQAREIRKLPAYDAVKREFDIEYEVAREVAKARANANMAQRIDLRTW